jgi:putative ABC transport system ATP-binding protein
MSPPNPIVDARELGRYDAATDTWLLRRASLSVEAGARIVVTGPSGSGKTLLLRALAWLDPLDEGELRWHGQPLAPSTVPSFRSHVIYLHQRPALIEGTVADNLKYPFTLALHGKRRFHEDRARSYLASLERSAEFLQKLGRDLSGGEAQITALLRAVQLEPEVLLLDEPTAALDPAATRAVEQCVDQWFREAPRQRAIVWVSHDRDQAARVADRVIAMEAGTVSVGE